MTGELCSVANSYHLSKLGGGEILYRRLYSFTASARVLLDAACAVHSCMVVRPDAVRECTASAVVVVMGCVGMSIDAKNENEMIVP